MQKETTVRLRAAEVEGTELPFDEGTFARVLAISSTVVAAILAQVLLAPFGI